MNWGMKRGVFVWLTLLVAMTTMAQKAVVSGTVANKTTGQVVSGASVTAEGLSVVTNDDGFFMLKCEKQPKKITVTHVGFRPEHIDLDGKLAENLKIHLQPTTVQLREVIVMADNPRELVQLAISKIPQNYSQHPELYHCFYRETAMKRQHYICVAEGVVDMYKTDYEQGIDRDRVAIRKGRRLLSPKLSDTLSVKVLGGPVAPVQLDIVKNTGLSKCL